MNRWRNEDGIQNLRSGAVPRVSISCFTRDTDHLIKTNPNFPKHVSSVVYEKNEMGEANGRLVISFRNIFSNLLRIFSKF